MVFVNKQNQVKNHEIENKVDGKSAVGNFKLLVSAIFWYIFIWE